jgi:predicted phage terminase large subunit-like protein
MLHKSVKMSIPSLDDIKAVRSLNSFEYFVKSVWPIIDPAELIWGDVMTVLCNHAQAFISKKIETLVVNVPPGFSKTMLFSVMLPAWAWLKYPMQSFLCATHCRDLTLTIANKRRRLIESPEYCNIKKRLGFSWEMLKDNNKISEYGNNENGTMIATSVESGATGKRGDYRIIDDPIDTIDALKAENHDKVASWYDNQFKSRTNSYTWRPLLIVMQRTHEIDLSRKILKEVKNAVHLNLQIERDFAKNCDCRYCQNGKSPIGWKDNRKQGELLFPERFPQETVDDYKKVPSVFNTQYQQSPQPSTGNIIKIQSLTNIFVTPSESVEITPIWPSDIKPKIKRLDPTGSFDDIIIFTDADLKGKDTSDRVAIVTACRRGADYYILDMDWGNMDFMRALHGLIVMRNKWKRPNLEIAIEDTQKGSILIEFLRKEIPITAAQPIASKEIRVSLAARLFESGNVWLPGHAAWLPDFVKEAGSFPLGSHDDAIDATSSALLRMQSRVNISEDSYDLRKIVRFS